MYTYFGEKRTALKRHCFSRHLEAVWVTVIANPEAEGDHDRYLVIFEHASREMIYTAKRSMIPTAEQIETMFAERSND